MHLFNNILSSLAIAAGAFFLASCSSNKSDDESASLTVDDANIEIVDYAHGPKHLTPAQLDSLAVNSIDELTPGQAVGVLVYYSELADKATGSKRLETMSKFRDVYGIVLGNYGSDFRSAVAKVKSEKGIDLSAIYDKYAERLTSYDEGSGVYEAPEEQKPDSTAVQTEATAAADSIQ